MKFFLAFTLVGFAAALTAPSQNGASLRRALDDHTVYPEPKLPLMEVGTEDGLTLIGRNMSPHQAEGWLRGAAPLTRETAANDASKLPFDDHA